MSVHPQKDNDVQQLLNENKYVFIKWGADFCGPCKKIQPFYDQLAETYKKDAVFITLEVDNDEFEDRVHENNVSSIPLFQMYVNGKLSKSMVGSNKTELKSFVTVKY